MGQVVGKIFVPTTCFYFGVTFDMTAIEQYFPVVFIVQYRVVLTFESVDKMLKV